MFSWIAQICKQIQVGRNMLPYSRHLSQPVRKICSICFHCSEYQTQMSRAKLNWKTDSSPLYFDSIYRLSKETNRLQKWCHILVLISSVQQHHSCSSRTDLASQTRSDCEMCYITVMEVCVQTKTKKQKTTRLTQSRVVVTVLTIWPAMLLVAVVTGHCLKLDLFGQGREIWERNRYKEGGKEVKKKKKRKRKKEKNQ